jgi:hypothetical protein
MSPNKVLLVFKGQNQRHRHDYDGVISATECLDNWNATLFDDLRANGVPFDTALVTYGSPILNELVQKIQPSIVIADGYSDQMGNMLRVADLMIEQREAYGRFVILRFDFQYRIRITKWNKWDHDGIILANKDVGWNTGKNFHDLVFIIDNRSVEHFKRGVESCICPVTGRYNNMIGHYLYHNGVRFELMYEHGYNMVKHPLYAYKYLDDEPDLENPNPGTIVVHASQFKD